MKVILQQATGCFFCRFSNKTHRGQQKRSLLQTSVGNSWHFGADPDLWLMDPHPGGPKNMRIRFRISNIVCHKHIKIKLQSDGKVWIRIQVRIRIKSRWFRSPDPSPLKPMRMINTVCIKHWNVHSNLQLLSHAQSTERRSIDSRGCGSAFISSGSNILGWIPIRFRIQNGSWFPIRIRIHWSDWIRIHGSATLIDR